MFKRSPFLKPFFFIATTAALLIHVGALCFAPTQLVLRVEPIGMDAWSRMAIVAASIVVAIEIHKLIRRDTRVSPDRTSSSYLAGRSS